MTTIAQAVAKLRDAYPRQTFGDRTIRLYGEQLADLPDGAVFDAAVALIRVSAFLPTVAEIRRQVAEQTLGVPTPEEAWDLACAGLLQVPEVRQSVNAVGGTWAVNHGNQPDVTRRSFIENYRGRRETTIRRAMLGGTPRASDLPLAVAAPASLNARRLAAIPETTSMRMRPMSLRTMRRMAGLPLAAATDEERHDAILVLHVGGPTDDPMIVEATRMLDEAGRT